MDPREGSPQDNELIDIFAHLRENDFLHLARTIEEEIQLEDGAGQLTAASIKQRLEQLEEVIGQEYLNMPVKLFGYGHVVKPDNQLTGEGEIIEPTRDVTYMGMRLCLYESAYTIGLRFYDCNTPDRGYMVFPAAILSLDVINPRQNTWLKQELWRQADEACQIVCDPGFFASPYELQQKILSQVTRDIDEALTSFCGEDALDIDCGRYYRLSDTADTIVPQLVDQRSVSYEDQEAPYGHVLGTVYLEWLCDQTSHFTRQSDFSYGGGAPCLVLRNNSEPYTYFVPMDEVTGVQIDECDEDSE